MLDARCRWSRVDIDHISVRRLRRLTHSFFGIKTDIVTFSGHIELIVVVSEDSSIPILNDVNVISLGHGHT